MPINPSLQIKTLEQAETIAASGFAFLAADPDRLGRFLALTGVGPDAIAAAVAQPEFLAGVMQHICEDESLLLTFCGEQRIDPELAVQAQLRLAGRPGNTGAL